MPDGRDGRAWEAMQGWLDRPRPATAPSSTVEPSGRALGGARRRARPLLRPAVRVLLGVLRRGARARAAEADLVIVNHALYFAHVASGGGVLPEHDAVIFDEAHRLEESAASWLGGRVSRAGLRRLARRHRARLPRGARARARRGSSTASSERASVCCARSRRRRAASGCASRPPSRRSS